MKAMKIRESYPIGGRDRGRQLLRSSSPSATVDVVSSLSHLSSSFSLFLSHSASAPFSSTLRLSLPTPTVVVVLVAHCSLCPSVSSRFSHCASPSVIAALFLYPHLHCHSSSSQLTVTAVIVVRLVLASCTAVNQRRLSSFLTLPLVLSLVLTPFSVLVIIIIVHHSTSSLAGLLFVSTSHFLSLALRLFLLKLSLLSTSSCTTIVSQILLLFPSSLVLWLSF